MTTTWRTNRIRLAPQDWLEVAAVFGSAIVFGTRKGLFVWRPEHDAVAEYSLSHELVTLAAHPRGSLLACVGERRTTILDATFQECHAIEGAQAPVADPNSLYAFSDERFWYLRSGEWL